VRVVALSLPYRIEDPVGPGIGTSASDPLPVELVVGDVGVDQQIEEVLGA
jgi:hypothetical protein